MLRLLKMSPWLTWLFSALGTREPELSLHFSIGIRRGLVSECLAMEMQDSLEHKEPRAAGKDGLR